jgi:hypothetical protein
VANFPRSQIIVTFLCSKKCPKVAHFFLTKKCSNMNVELSIIKIELSTIERNIQHLALTANTNRAFSCDS